jgi:hypothetical protein
MLFLLTYNFYSILCLLHYILITLYTAMYGTAHPQCMAQTSQNVWRSPPTNQLFIIFFRSTVIPVSKPIFYHMFVDVPNKRPYLSHFPQCNVTILLRTCFSNSSFAFCAAFFSFSLFLFSKEGFISGQS